MVPRASDAEGKSCEKINRVGPKFGRRDIRGVPF